MDTLQNLKVAIAYLLPEIWSNITLEQELELLIRPRYVVCTSTDPDIDTEREFIVWAFDEALVAALCDLIVINAPIFRSLGVRTIQVVFRWSIHDDLTRINIPVIAKIARC